MTTNIVKTTTGSPLAQAKRSAGRVYLNRFPNPISRRSMRASLIAVMRAAEVDPKLIDPEDFPWEQMTFEAATTIRSNLMTRYKTRSASHHITALVGVLKVATRLGLMPRETLSDMTERGGPLSAVHGDTPLAGRMLEPSEVMSTIERAASGRLQRDAAIIALAAYCGLRRAEIAGLNLDDVSPNVNTLTVVGKGNKTRVVPLSTHAQEWLRRYIRERGSDPGPLFFRARKGRGKRNGRLVDGARLTPHTVWRIILDVCKDAALAVRTTPHDFRRTFASTLIDEGVDLVTVRDLMGHESIETTIRYDRRGDERKKRAAAVLDRVFGPRAVEPEKL